MNNVTPADFSRTLTRAYNLTSAGAFSVKTNSSRFVINSFITISFNHS